MPAVQQAEWRAMRAGDLPAIKAISDAVHGKYTECEAVYAEKLVLYPQGCFVLDLDGGVAGYLVSHPWRGNAPPALDRLIGALPSRPDSFYLHDMALLPSARRTGAGRAGAELVIRQAREAGFGEVKLVAIGGAETFWARQGYGPCADTTSSYGTGTIAMRRGL